MKQLTLAIISMMTIAILTACAFAEKPNIRHLAGNWQIRTLNNEPTPDTTARIRFDPRTNRYFAYFGCNYMTGRYQDFRHDLYIDQPFGINKLCQNIEDERTGIATLRFVARWRIINDTAGVHLHLLDKDNYVRVEALLIKQENNQPQY